MQTCSPIFLKLIKISVIFFMKSHIFLLSLKIVNQKLVCGDTHVISSNRNYSLKKYVQ